MRRVERTRYQSTPQPTGRYETVSSNVAARDMLQRIQRTNSGSAKGTMKLQESIDNLTKLRSWQPYRFGGTWYLAEINGEAYQRRTKKSLMHLAAKAGLASLEITISL